MRKEICFYSIWIAVQDHLLKHHPSILTCSVTPIVHPISKHTWVCFLIYCLSTQMPFVSMIKFNSVFMIHRAGLPLPLPSFLQDCLGYSCPLIAPYTSNNQLFTFYFKNGSNFIGITFNIWPLSSRDSSILEHGLSLFFIPLEKLCFFLSFFLRSQDIIVFGVIVNDIIFSNFCTLISICRYPIHQSC